MDSAARRVIVTGGSGAVGRAVAARWLSSGASVLLVGSQQRSVDEALAELRGGPLLHGFAADLTTEAGAQQMASEAARVLHRPADTLIHLVGGFAMNRVEAADAAAIWQRMTALNATSALHCFRAAIGGFRESGERGWIVGLASKAALRPGPQVAAYAASKAALIALSRSLAEETKREPIAINIIAASTIDTAANRAAMGDTLAAGWVSAAEIAEATAYLCSDAANSATGAVLEMYGRE